VKWAITGRIIVIVGVVAFALPLVLGGTAQARSKAKPKFNPIFTRTATTFGSGHESVITATAHCPTPKHGHSKIFPVGGGFQETPPSPAAEGIIFQSQLFGRGWRVSAQISDRIRPADDPVVLTAYVYCRGGDHKLQTEASTVPTGGLVGKSPLTSVSCPSNDLTLVAGGFLTSLPVTFSNYILSSNTASKTEGAWHASLFAGTLASQLTTETYCAKGVRARTASFGVTSNNHGAPDFTQVIKDTPCSFDPGEKRSPVNGGFIIGDARTTATLLLYASYKLGKSWRVAGVLRRTPADTDVVALGGYAYC
jgi:hypothetical protein